MTAVTSAQKRIRADGLTKIVRESLSAGQKLWGALTALKEEELYLLDYDTWEEFCLKEFNISVRHADRLIEAGNTLKTIQIPNKLDDPIGPTGSDAIRPSQTVPTALKERQARALKNIPKEKRTAVLEQVAANGQVTAKKIADAAKAVPVELHDDTGYPIPAKLHQFWNRRQEMQKLMTAVSQIKVVIEKARAEDDVFFRPVNQAAIDQLERTYSFLSDAKPYAVCLNCQGHANDTCRACKGTGLISKFGYEVRGDKQARAMRQAVLAKGKT